MGECDLIAKVAGDGRMTGYLYLNNGTFETDRIEAPPVSNAALRALAQNHGQEVTFTCVPPGSGERMGIDHDQDGCLDGDEQQGGNAGP